MDDKNQATDELEPTTADTDPTEVGDGEAVDTQDFGDEFDAGWDDGAVASESTSAKSNPDEDPDSSVESEDEGQPSEEARSEADDSDDAEEGEEEPSSEAVGEGAVSESSQEQPPKSKASEEPPAGTDNSSEPDPREAELARLRKALHDSQSEIGRVRGFVKERDEQIESLKQNVPESPPVAEALPPLTDEERETVKKYEDEVDPDTSQVISLIVRDALARERADREAWQQSLESKHQGIEAWREQQDSEREDARTQQGIQELDTKYGTTWREDFNEGRITAWIQTLPPNIGTSYQSILDNSSDAADAMFLMDQFYAANPERLPEAMRSQEAETDTEDAAEEAETAKPSKAKAEDPKLAQRRQSQKRGGSPTPRSGNPTPRGNAAGASDGLPRGSFSTDPDFNKGWEEGALRSA